MASPFAQDPHNKVNDVLEIDLNKAAEADQLAYSVWKLAENKDSNTPQIQQPESVHKIELPPPRTTLDKLKSKIQTSLCPSGLFLRSFKDHPRSYQLLLAIKYAFPIFDWAPKYKLSWFKSDLIAGLTIASLAIPQGISYAKLAGLPPILGLYSSFVPPLLYAVLGSSKDLAVGTVSVVSLLLRSLLEKEDSNPLLHLQLAITATFFAGIFQASLGLLRLGVILDFLSHATIVGFMSGAAIMITLQQLKGFLGIQHFTTKTDLVSVLHSVIQAKDEWNWRTAVIGSCFLMWLLVARTISKKKKQLYWVSALAPLVSVIVGTLSVYLTRADKHGVNIVGHLKSGLNPSSVNMIYVKGEYALKGMKIGLLTGLIALTEAMAVGRTFAALKDYQIDTNKEMIAMGLMNIAGSCTSCYVTTGSLTRSAISFNAGSKTTVMNIVMATVVMITLLFLMPLFQFTPSAILSAVIVAAVINLIDIPAIITIWKVDKMDFLALLGALIGVLSISIEAGLLIAIGISMLRILLHVTRPHITLLGNIPGTSIYRDMQQYPDANPVQGVLILRIDTAIYFSNANYIRERVSTLVMDEELSTQNMDEKRLHFVILEFSAATSIDTTGVHMLEDLRRFMTKRNVLMAIVNPGRSVIEKLQACGFIERLGKEWMFVNVAEAITKCSWLPTNDDGDIILERIL